MSDVLAILRTRFATDRVDIAWIGGSATWAAPVPEWTRPHPILSDIRVRQAIAGLPEPHRRVIELAFFSGLTHREIAERLGEPLGTVHSRARQAMLLLRQKLPEFGPEPGLDDA